MTTCLRLFRSDRNVENERGAVLVTVLVMILTFFLLGGVLLLATRLFGGYERNREWSLQAEYAAEGAIHKAIANIMLSPGTSNFNTTGFTDQAVEPGYPATMDAIIERVPGKYEFRIYGRGRAGTNWRDAEHVKPVTRYLRAYIRTSSTLGYSGTVTLLDWQEINETTVRAHRNVLQSTDSAKAAEFAVWLGE